MFLKISFSLILLCVLTVVATYAQRERAEKLPIINGRATHLPSPAYPEEAKDFCAGGTVSVRVELDEKGDVTAAEAISGDELLRAPSVEAAKEAKFAPTAEVPVKTKGIVVYSFSPGNKCVNGGVVNKRALFLPKPDINPGAEVKEETSVVVNVLIDESGKVIRAGASSDIHPLLRTAFESAARQATFPPTLINGAAIKVKGVIVYKLKPNAPGGN